MKYIPNLVIDNFLSIDFNKLYEDGFRFIISDLDNTLAAYTVSKPSEELIKKIKEIKALGFKFYLVSNNNKKRLEIFNQLLCTDGFLEKAGKPKSSKILNFFVKEGIDGLRTIGIGDQLVTDILGFNRSCGYSILVKTIDKKTQKWYTKINRIREKRIIKKIKKVNLEIGSRIEKL